MKKRKEGKIKNEIFGIEKGSDDWVSCKEEETRETEKSVEKKIHRRCHIIDGKICRRRQSQR